MTDRRCRISRFTRNDIAAEVAKKRFTSATEMSCHLDGRDPLYHLKERSLAVLEMTYKQRHRRLNTFI